MIHIYINDGGLMMSLGFSTIETEDRVAFDSLAAWEVSHDQNEHFMGISWDVQQITAT
jgi:hypothetical protein